MDNTLICNRCGEKTERTGKNQKLCPSCAKIVNQERKRHAARMTRRKKRKSVATTTGAEALCQWKPDTRGIGECPRWNKCAYGAEESDKVSSDVCRYHEITGYCKVVVIDGVRTVEPTKNCRFFKPKGEAADDARK